MSLFYSLFSTKLKPKVIHETPIARTMRKILIVIFIILCTIIAYYIGVSKDNTALIKANTLVKEEQFNEFQTSRDKLQQELTITESKLMIQTTTIEDLRLTIKQMQSEYDKLSNDVNMYKNILDSASKIRHVEVAKLHIARILEENTDTNNDQKFIVDTTLIQRSNRRVKINGSAYLEIIAQDNNGDLTTLNYAQLTDSAKNKYLNFRFFQNLKYPITIPQDYNPIKLKVVVNSRQLSRTIVQEFDWVEYIDIDLTEVDCEKPT